jgi:hypothetical protein
MNEQYTDHREDFALPPDADADLPFADYLEAYRYGWQAHERQPARTFGDAEPELRAGWEQRQGQPAWDRARSAVHDAWERIGRWQTAPPGLPAEHPAGW